MNPPLTQACQDVKALAPPLSVVHSDWSKDSPKRWMASATLDRRTGEVQAFPTEQVTDSENLVRAQIDDKGREVHSIYGFDFPLGIPASYAYRADVSSFLGLLASLGEEAEPDFFRVAETDEQISLGRPFYPYRARLKGEVKQEQLWTGLGLASSDDLFRECERSKGGEQIAACPLFWTLGANQVGKGAISGWREVVIPALVDKGLDVAVWPFDGALSELAEKRRVTLCETYPAEFYGHLGIDRTGLSKRRQESRREAAKDLLEWAEKCGVELSEKLSTEIRDGFGESATGEDRFDAVVGLFGMLNVLLGHRESGEEKAGEGLAVEGWILGR